MMRLTRRASLTLAGAGLLAGARAQSAALGTLRVGVLQFGTVMWELDVIKHHGLDLAHGFELAVQPFGGNDAADVALMGGAVDAIVEDWLWVSRQRSNDALLTFVPYSSSVGALMSRGDSDLVRLEQLAGTKIGIAGGPLDKSWLILQGYARQAGFDLANQAEPVYAAPPLLNEKLKSGELDSILNYWHWCARLEAEGHRRILSVADALEALGIPASTPQLGYVFQEDWATAHPEPIAAFTSASRVAKQILDGSDAEWERIRPLTRAENDETLNAFKRRYREGIVREWGEAQREAAGRLFILLAELGGERLVGRSTELAPGTFWSGVSY
jgi:NitT/TauT family transport system substrate-binding protein